MRNKIRLYLKNWSMIKYGYAVLIGIGPDYGLYTLLYYSFGLNFIISNLCSFSFGTLIALICIRKFVFKKARFPFWKDYILSLINNGTVFFLWVITLSYFVNTYHINHYLWKTIVITITFFINYSIRKILFSHANNGN